ncbi:hypothetical protein Q766_19445 [Flavobacterium subsaxonicum WB 4.1-42 = DSM 21790]|uniref:Uncharacterized protein n=1 Tax=Flavobacterium subsaxonicum WB 4.1-42 = DSM 21790 TaxID=1121898 RepID=A0A0A2MSC4_9FLAO|nr:hypothetical protein Q766_19445 [Flavobacterium subsaxonicum WB 4.1-42 = DSM 21790]
MPLLRAQPAERSNLFKIKWFAFGLLEWCEAAKPEQIRVCAAPVPSPPVPFGQARSILFRKVSIMR